MQLSDYSTYKEAFMRMFLAGISIGIASLSYLNMGGIIGAIIFSFGLIIVVKNKYLLFTGISGFSKDPKLLLLTLLFNIIGCGLMGLIPASAVNPIVVTRLATPLYKIFFLSMGCGFIMTNAVKYAKQNQWLPLLFGVPIFIFCGFPHCIADVAYYANLPLEYFMGHLSQILLIYVTTIIGNFIGCNIPTTISKWFNIDEV